MDRGRKGVTQRELEVGDKRDNQREKSQQIGQRKLCEQEVEEKENRGRERVE